ncbi:glutathione S-transferase [Nordella sp. HKS 07]|uniref:glutathione S-transferase n=1 Tax=Nordella sp. HKS 07 TaxID=2712222 RepID=UPI0013E14053|nr:glutathione S-transferase [Nordella sp. HKS 07]QIG52325.1 glutathione S-transferase [Nordella sp. HKS 07]
MKLFYAPTSPYVRKVMVTAHELGLADGIEKLPSAAHPVKRDERIALANPLAKIPAAITPEGDTLFDSRVICEYLDANVPGRHLFPAEQKARWRALTLQALGDGLLDAALLSRYEMTARPEARQWADWVQGQMTKVDGALARLEEHVETLSGPLTIGLITIGCALGYLDFRFAHRPWREDHPRLAAWYAVFAERPSMQATIPRDAS